jgi:hypothetical protein
VLDPAPVVDSAPPQFWTSRRIAGAAVGGVGVAGLLTGAIFGGLTLAKASSSKAHCQSASDGLVCDDAGLALRSDGRTFAKVSDVALVVGGVATAVGIGLVVAPEKAAPRPVALRVGTSGSGLWIEGAW